MSSATDNALIAVISGEAEQPCIGAVSTPITLLNANAMSAAGESFISASKTVQVELDMEKVEPSSVAVAVTLAWLASAQRHGKSLCLGNLSADFSGVIEFSGISSMFADHISDAK